MSYQEKQDASHLIGKHYIIPIKYGMDICVELTLISIEKITRTKEFLVLKKPIYKDLSTQAPPIDVMINKDGMFRLINGHRRLKSAIARGEKSIFAKIHYRKSHRDLVLEAYRNGKNVPKEILDYYKITFELKERI
ncbi:ParB N-terminal domain-containing protein [Wukongibacter baidiensis]|uniref:ParB N-terminal domain-containing protein n=1 Tax=Wukongibacter baidiensis TaxID=1723361 RepID=UPI003D7F355C